jgi:hypothetical protein
MADDDRIELTPAGDEVVRDEVLAAAMASEAAEVAPQDLLHWADDGGAADEYPTPSR